MEELMSVSVTVPRGRLAELYTQCSSWLRELETSEWSGEGSLSDAQILYGAISGPAREILDFLIDHPGEQFSTKELVRELGSPRLPNVARLTGSLSSITKRAKEAGRDVPYKDEKQKEGEERRYWLDPEVAEVFRQAREDAPRRRGVNSNALRGIAHLQQGAEDVAQEGAPMTDEG